MTQDFFVEADPSFLISETELNHPVRSLIAELAKEVGRNVLDVGCNVCMDYPYMTAKDLIYVGVDKYSQFIIRAQELYPKVAVRTADVFSLPFDDNLFHTVYCKDLLEHLEYDRVPDALSEMWRVANRMMMLSFFNMPLKKKISWHDSGFWNNTLDSMELRRWLHALGVRSTRIIPNVLDRQELWILKP